MHGRPRTSLKSEDAASVAKAANLRTIQAQVLENHQNKVYTKEALEVNSKLLEINPESYTAWNYRKLAVEHNLLTESNPDSIKELLNEELRVVENALRRNFKSYGAWHHRKWVLDKGFSSLDHEFRLLDQFQKADSRNFLAWNYRRFVAALKKVSEEEELKFTTDMIEANFSNYSAWHNRSVLLSHLLNQKAQGFVSREKVLTEEYELVHQALFTDPDDQSGWFYHLWLLHQTVTPDTPVLVSSWPVHGSDLIVSFNGLLNDFKLSPFTSFHSDTGEFPLILFFNQAVEGVKVSTIVVNSLLDKNEDLIWRPLSTNTSGKARAWVTYLKFPDVSNALNAYPVEVTVGDSQGIISSSGSKYSQPSHFKFTVSLKSVNSENAESGCSTEMIVWKNDRFHDDITSLENLGPVDSFDQLRINMDHELAASGWHAETIANEIALFRELLSEINCKIGKFTLARLLMAHDTIMSYKAPSTHKNVHFEEVLELFKDLMKLDPPHTRFYKDEHSLVLMEKVTSTRESVLRHCWNYMSTSSSLHRPVCLRLNGLSLSRIGSFERLLWVQMLDLSFNELHSIEGLEVMQLLSCLNLSNNKMSSFTALEPLRLLKSLKVLDISYNEIGSHSIDTTRYLCSSPLSHTMESDWSVNEYLTEGIEAVKYWEAILLFRGLQLKQLDIGGNPVIDEKLRCLLVSILPSLRWLDGEAVH